MEHAFDGWITMPQPDGWRPERESLTIVAQDGSANVIASSEPVPRDVDARQYAEIQRGPLRDEFNEFRELSFEPAIVFGGRPGYRRTFSFVSEDGSEFTMIQLYYAFMGRGFTATATTHSASFAEREGELRRIMDGMVAR